MNVQDSKLAKKYAAAFLNIYENQLSLDDYFALQQAVHFFDDNRQLLTYFKLPRILAEKKEALRKIQEAFNLPKVMDTLMELLLDHQRLFLIKYVFEALLILFRERNNIMTFSIISSHTLEKNQLQSIKDFLEKKTRNTILYNKEVDKKLIAGIRLQSTTYLWEYSIEQQLREARQALRS